MSYARGGRSYTRRRRSSPRRSPTSDRNDYLAHRRAAGPLRSRLSLCNAADCPGVPSTSKRSVKRILHGSQSAPRGMLRCTRESIGLGTGIEESTVHARTKTGLAVRISRVAPCSVWRLLEKRGFLEIARERKLKTAITDNAAPQPADLVQRQFAPTRPNQLWVADLTYVANWSDYVRAAFVIDALSCKTAGWRVARSLRSDLALDALERAFHACGGTENLIYRSDWGVQGLSISYTEQSAGSVGDCYDNAAREHHWLAQDGGDSTQRTVPEHRAWEVRDLQVCGSVQQPTATGADRGRSSCRVRGAALRESGSSGDGRRTQTMKLPTKTGAHQNRDENQLDRPADVYSRRMATQRSIRQHYEAHPGLITPMASLRQHPSVMNDSPHQ